MQNIIIWDTTEKHIELIDTLLHILIRQYGDNSILKTISLHPYPKVIRDNNSIETFLAFGIWYFHQIVSYSNL